MHLNDRHRREGSAMDVPFSLVRRAVELVAQAAEIDHSAEFPAVVLSGLAGLIGCDTLSYNEIRLDLRRVRYLDHPAGALDPSSSLTLARFIHQHPLVNHYQTTEEGKARRISDFLSRTEFHRLGLYAEFYRQIPVEHQLAVQLPGTRNCLIGLAFNRQHAEFADTDLELLNVLRGPLSAALARARARQRAQRALRECDQVWLAALTSREVQVLEQVAVGRTNVAIGRALDVSPRTVAKHLERIYRKLGVGNRAGAVSVLARPGHG
jgi:DNA-binding CsgD family transcriptional regulator